MGVGIEVLSRLGVGGGVSVSVAIDVGVSVGIRVEIGAGVGLRVGEGAELGIGELRLNNTLNINAMHIILPFNLFINTIVYKRGSILKSLYLS